MLEILTHEKRISNVETKLEIIEMLLDTLAEMKEKKNKQKRGE